MNEIERQAMDWLLRGDHPVLETLRSQLSTAVVRGRDFTGVGFFTQFAVPVEAPRLSQAQRFVIGDVYGEVTGLQHGAGFLLFIKNGALDTLECFIHEDAWPTDAKLLRLYYVRPEPAGGIELRETAVRDLEWALLVRQSAEAYTRHTNCALRATGPSAAFRAKTIACTF